MADNREISKKEKQIIKDIMSRSNYGEEKASKIAKEMVDFGYTIHEQDYFKLKNIIKILKDKIELPLENDFDVVNKDDIHLYRLRTKCLINEEEYELLKEVLFDER